MIASLRGKIIVLEQERVVLEVGGVGYECSIPLVVYVKLRKLPPDDTLTLLTEMVYSEKNGPALYGFLQPGERVVFRLLLSGSGVGQRTALAALSALSPEELARALAVGDERLLCRIPGIGKKTAAKLCLELKERAAKLTDSIITDPGTGGSSRSDALAALLALGYNRVVAEEAVAAALSGSDADPAESPTDDSVEKLISRALSHLK
ncbi:Holliday junction branch migration protein RuvA [bacterium]|nr:Holliday junction branch migration protein RuvA [bacterium]